jgi:hypothetical protein
MVRCNSILQTEIAWGKVEVLAEGPQNLSATRRENATLSLLGLSLPLANGKTLFLSF